MRMLVAWTYIFAFACGTLHAQEAPQLQRPGKEHKWLEKFVGDWDVENEGKAGSDQPPMKLKGSMSSKMVGGFWMVTEMKGNVAGMKIQTLLTVGYNVEKKKYVATWIDSMVNYMWQYEGTVDETGKVLTFIAEGPNFMAGGETMKFRDSYEFKTPDHIITKSALLGKDGKWVTFMTGSAKRKKSEPRGSQTSSGTEDLSQKARSAVPPQSRKARQE